MSNKYLLGILAIAILALALAHTVQATPYLQLMTPWGKPFAKQDVIIVVFNQSDNCIVAYAQGKTNSTGWIPLTLTNKTKITTDFKYNISVFWLAYGRTFLANTTFFSNDISFLNNITLNLGFLWNASLKAITNINGKYKPLYFPDPEIDKADVAYFEVWLYKKDGAPIFTSKGNDTGNSKWIILPTVEVDIKPQVGNPACFHIEKAWNVTLYKEVSWLINTGNQSLKILVGRENVTLYTILDNWQPTIWHINITEFLYWDMETSTVFSVEDGDISAYASQFGVTADDTKNRIEIVDIAHTFLARVEVQDPCGNTLTGWEWPPINVEFSTPHLGKLRVGKVNPDNAIAPEEGYTLALGGVVYFWLPNVSLFYKGENMTLAAEINGIQVFSGATFNTTKFNTGFNLQAKLANQTQWTYLTATSEGSNVFKFSIKVGVVKAKIRVKDSGLTAVQPLEGAMVVIQAPGYDPINTYTDGAGYVALPPFTISAGGSTREGTPIIARQGQSPGYLPVPFDLLLSNKTYTYTVRIYYALPGSENFVDVTPDNNVIKLIPIIKWCQPQSFNLTAKVYNVNILVLDLCNRSITSLDDRNASLIVTYTPPEGAPITFSAGLGGNGITFLGKVPGGSFKVQLAFKGVLMDPVSGPVPLVVMGNVANVSQATYVFPIGDIVFRVTQWDVKEESLYNISATLTYYKGNIRMYVDGPKPTNCSGLVKFEKVPLVTTNNTKVILVLRTTKDTPYIRPQDAGLLVGKWDLTSLIASLNPACNIGPIDVPAWIFSFTLEAVDHAGNILKALPTSNGTAPVIVALNDTTYGYEVNLTAKCTEPGCLCWPNILVDYRLFNATGFAKMPWGNGISEARFKFTSSQFMNSWYPHLFVAGANYSFIVWYSGVMVYNYSFTMPAPSEPLDYKKVINAQVIYYNESEKMFTKKAYSLAKTEELNYTWILEKKGMIVHPIVRFYSASAWSGRYSIRVQLVTWVIDLDVFTFSKEGEGLIPGLNVTLLRSSDVVFWKTQLKGNTYMNVTRFSEYRKSRISGIAWSAVDENADGVIRIPVAVWAPTSPGLDGVKFGANVAYVYVLAGSMYGTPGVPDTPFDSTIPNIGILYGYVVGPYNVTEDKFFFSVVPNSQHNESIDWFKLYKGNWVGPFRKPATWIGQGWNLTLWSGAAKLVYTTAMEGFCVEVAGPDLRWNMVPMANQPVKVAAVGITPPRPTVPIASGVTGPDGTVTFYPAKGASINTPKGSVPVFTAGFAFLGLTKKGYTLTRLSYDVSTNLNFDQLLTPYKLKTTDVLDPETLTETVKFTPYHNMPGGWCVSLEWSAILVTVFDWSGKPLQNAMVAAYLRTPYAKAYPSTFNFTNANGVTMLYVPPYSDYSYQLIVYWRDSLLLRAAGKIPKEIAIFDTLTDYDTPRYYTPGSGTTLETFVYVAKLVLTNAQGGSLSQSLLNKITVTVTWPDGVVTKHTPASDGSIILRLAKDTVVSWPFDPSSKYSPETPADHGQAPHGAYQVKVDLAGVGTVAPTQTIKIEKGRFETSLQVFQVKLDIYDIQLTFTTPFGTPMAGASVQVTTPDGRTISDTLDSSGSITIKEVAPGKVGFTVSTWKGLNIGYTGSIDRVPAVGLTVPTIGKLTVKVLGARGQGIEGATVAIQNVGTFTTDASGVVTLEIPQGTYSVSASKGGRQASSTATVTGGKEATLELKLDIFLTIAGWEMSSSEFLGLILLLILLVLVIFIIAHEYSIYRRRRLAKVIAPAEGTQK